MNAYLAKNTSVCPNSPKVVQYENMQHNIQYFIQDSLATEHLYNFYLYTRSSQPAKNY